MLIYDTYGHQIGSSYTFVPIKVVGVTYKNGRRGRQTILRQIYWKDAPYTKIDIDQCIDLVWTEFEGSPAIEVWVYNSKSKEMIGYIPKDKVKYFVDNKDRYFNSYDFSVYGGGDVNFGASFTCRFLNSPEDQALYDNNLKLEQEKAEKERKAEEEKMQPYNRAYELFKLDYPEYSDVSFFPINSTERIGVNLIKNGKILYRAYYYPAADKILCYSVDDRPLPSRAHTFSGSKNVSSKSSTTKSNKKYWWILFSIFFGYIVFFYLLPQFFS